MTWIEQQGSSNVWLPTQPGDFLEGSVVGVEEGVYGRQYLIDSGSGMFRTPSHKVLQSRMNKVVVGDRVRIEFTGQDPPSVRGQNPVNIYRVFVWQVDSTASAPTPPHTVSPPRPAT